MPVEPTADPGETTDDAGGLDLRFNGANRLVGEVEDDGLPMVAAAWINSRKAQGSHKVIETKAFARLKAVARASASVPVVPADLDDGFNIVKQHVENGRSNLRPDDPHGLAHFQHSVPLWHDICSPVV